MTLETYSREVRLPVAVEEAFAWHERPGALARLIPPWENVRVRRRDAGLCNGAEVELGSRMGPLPIRWIAQHHDYAPNRQFCDRQIQGPFAYWDHEHRFEPDGSGASVLVDHVQYRIPGGALGRLLAGRSVADRINRMFAYRHETTTADLAAHACHREKGTMHIAITGSHGLVGEPLAAFLNTGNHQVTRLVRGAPSADEVAWDPAADEFDAAPLEGVDAIVHLAGESIAARRWNAAQKQRIRDSRVHATRVLCEGLAKLARPPRVLVCASAIGFYGHRADEPLDETSPAGAGFLAEVVRDWEAASAPASEAGIRVVNLRFGVILSPAGGALAKMLTPFRLGAGGIVGNGRQWWSWISIDDAVGAVHHALMTDALSGPVNAVVPSAVTNQEFTKVLGRVLSRPTMVPMPAFAARLALGEMADELLLASARVAPARLTETGYEFRHADLETALRHLLGRRK